MVAGRRAPSTALVFAGIVSAQWQRLTLCDRCSVLVGRKLTIAELIGGVQLHDLRRGGAT